MFYTLKDLVAFCYENKRHKGFKNFAWEQIGQQILDAVNHNKLYYVEDKYGVCGLCIASVKHAKKEIYIHHIVTVRSGFASLIAFADQKYPDYAITGLRRSKLVTFNKRHLWATKHQAQTKAQERCSKP